MKSLGPLEQDVMTLVKDKGVISCGDAAKALAQSHGAIHTVLTRLEAKGLLVSHWSQIKPVRGGRRVRMFSSKSKDQ